MVGGRSLRISGHLALTWLGGIRDRWSRCILTLDTRPAGAYKVGFGLWNYPAFAFALEIALLFGGIALYLRTTEPKDAIGRYGMVIFGFVAVALQAYVFFGPLPVSDTAMALTALGLYFAFALAVYWLEGKRS